MMGAPEPLRGPPPLPGADQPMVWRLWHFAVAFLGGLLTANVAFGLLATTTADGLIDLDSVTANQLFGIVIPAQHAGTLAVVAMIVVAKRESFASALGFDLDIRHIWWVGVGAGVAIVVSLLMIPLASWLDVQDNPQRVVEQFGDVASGLPLLAAVLSLVVLTPITEEILYRGVLQRAVGRWLAAVPMVAVTSIVWGLAHLLDPADADTVWWSQALITFVPITIFGVIAATATVLAKGRLGRAVFLHGGWNLLGVIALIGAQMA